MNVAVKKPRVATRKPKRGAAPGKTLAEHAYELIKERIVSARYVPGQFLQEADICAELKLGRTPVHQALHRLQQESLLEVIPRKGILINADSLGQILTALEVRALVEPYCAAQCAIKATDADIAVLRQLLKDYERLPDQGDKVKLMEYDRRFHSMIAQVAGNQLIVDFLRPIHERMSRIWFLPHWQTADFGRTGAEHDGLVAALERRDPEAASAAMREHIESLRKRILAAGS
jgi:DNA-binding GntR family transcriptional regulator